MVAVVAQAVRSWKGAIGIALMAVAAFAVGIGSTTAIYTVVRTVLLRPLPYADGERFVALYSARVNEMHLRGSLSLAHLAEYQQRTNSFDVFGWFSPSSATLIAAGEPQHVNALVVTPSLAHNLGVQPALGRWFDDETGAVISHGLWQRLGGDAGVIGRGIVLNDRPLIITGVMPPTFRFPLPAPWTTNFATDVWVYLDPRQRDGGGAAFFAYARRKPGVTLLQAEDEVKRVAAEIATLPPAPAAGYTAILDDLHETGVFEIRPTLMLLFAAAGLLLLITCANVAGLLLTRAVARARETAMRVALGATQRQLATQYFTEALLLSLGGALAGLVVAAMMVRGVVTIAVDYIPRADEIALDWTGLSFAIGTALLASAASSFAPLWQAARTRPNDVLSDGVRASAGVRVRRLSQALVVAEIALAFTLLAVSAVLILHMQALRRVEPGFDTENLLTFELTLPRGIADHDDIRATYQRRLIEAVEGVSGVESASFANTLPLDGCCVGGEIFPEGGPPRAAERNSFVLMDAGFFRTLRVPLLAGRLPTETDSSDELLAGVINEAAAKRYWPEQSPLDHYARLATADGPRFRILGVVRDVRNNGLDNPPVPEIYLLNSATTVNPMNFVVRSTLPPATLLPALREAIKNVDATLPLHDPITMAQIVQDSLSVERASSLMMTFFALAALLMATLGIYGLISYGVRQRRVEIGTRMALGATSREILGLVVGDGLRMSMAGIVIGLVGVAASAWLLVRFFDVQQLGVLPFVASATIVGAVAVVASSFPAWRATRLSPLVAIRNEPRSTWQTTTQTIHAALHGISQAVAGAEERATISEGALLAEFAATARAAETFDDAIGKAVAILRERLGAASVVLFDRRAGCDYRCSVATPDVPECSLPAGGYLLGRLHRTTSPLPLTAEDLGALSTWAAAHKRERAHEFETLQTLRASLAVALRSKNEIVGVIVVGPPEGRHAYSQAEKDLLRASASQFALMLENARLTDRVVEQEKLRRDLALAAEVQRRLLPEHPPERGMASIAAVSLPARTVGGDYYDFIEIGGHQVGVALADVAGKGVAAALIMSVVQASLRIISSEGDISLPMLAAKMNHFLHRSTASNSYATFFYAQIDEAQRQLRYVNAGHNPPYLLRSGSEIAELSTGGAVIGLIPQLVYEEGKVDLRSGDVLVAFTDGVTEALNASEEEFGNDRLKDLLRAVVHLPVEEISAAISAALRNWIQDAPQYDDLTFVVVKVK